MNQREALAKLVRLYTTENELSEQIKDVKTEAKDSGLNPAILSAVAKAIVNNKVDDLKAKSTETLDTIELSRS